MSGREVSGFKFGCVHGVGFPDPQNTLRIAMCPEYHALRYVQKNSRTHYYPSENIRPVMIRFFDDNQAALAELNIDGTLAALLRTSLGCAGLASRISSAQSDRFAYAAAPRSFAS